MERMIDGFLDGRRRDGLLRKLTEVTLSANGTIETGGEKYINFSSNDYLGLAAHPRLAEAARKALSGSFGTSASRLMAGSTHFHTRLETRVAAFKGKPAALVFNSGYQANVGIISALCSRETCVFSDRLNHASIIDGIRLSGAELYRFRHNDTAHLEELLKKNRNKHRTAMIITETVFSMDGDISPLAEMARLKKEYDCIFMVDEAHATGIFGRTGSGLSEETGTSADTDIIMGTFSKALGGFGAYAASSVKMRDYLVNNCRSFIYSTALPATVIAADIEALDIVKDEPWRREKLIEKTKIFRDKLSSAGIAIKGSTQIIPIMSGTNENTVQLSEALKKKGYWVTPVRPPTVPEGESRVRISISYDHSREVLDKFVEDLSHCMEGSASTSV